MTVSYNTEYKPGDRVEASGIYRVLHDRQHHEPHEVTCVFGDHFPPCNGCGRHPRFKLVKAAKHITNHALFR